MSIPCPIHPTKRRWATVSAAQREADRLVTTLGVPFRAYLCSMKKGGCGWYHHTTEPRRYLHPEAEVAGEGELT